MKLGLTTMSLLFAAALIGFEGNLQAAETADALVIESIHLDGKEVVVTVQVPPGVKRVVLETRARIGSGSWEPVAIERLGDTATAPVVVVFRVQLSAQMELLRARGDSGDALPTSFYSGETKFGELSQSAGGPRAGFGDAVNAPEAPAGEKIDAPSAGGNRAVVESDIWKIRGDTMYFFNQYRGLQVIDIANPEAPVLRGTYSMPAAGEQMYLLDDDKAILLAHGFCHGWGADAESQIVLLEIVDGQPRAVGEMQVPGRLRESRMVGTALYVVSERYRHARTLDSKGSPEEVWEWGSQISSFDLVNFSATEPKFTLWVPGYGNAIQATDHFLFVATPQENANWWGAKSDVRVFDISSPDGTMAALSTIATAGRVKDKFKMHLDGDVFTVVTEVQDGALVTQLETFSLADPLKPERLGYLKIIEREQLFATRFAGKTLYAVTFERIDPLWIIDLSDPREPKKLGELEIPGWSTYIQPLGDKLVTVGIDNTDGWRTSVQLFDVSDPAKPTLASKVLVGEGNSSSEANQDEKAFAVLPEDNLILVPFSSWSENGQVQAVQLIDLLPDTLRKRGVIDHRVQPRRATVHKDRILSISGVELLAVDATDRDNPRVVSSTELSVPADQLFVEGEHLVTLATTENAPSIRVAPASNPTSSLALARLEALPLLGADVRDGRLFVIQGKPSEVIWPRTWNSTNAPLGTNDARLTMSVFDLSDLPNLKLLGEIEQTFPNETKYWGRFEALWPKADLLVWSAVAGYGWWDGPIIAMDVAIDRPAIGAPGIAPIWWGGGQSTLLAYDVSDSSAPKFASETKLAGTNNWWNFSRSFATDGLVFTSHQSSEFDSTVQLPPRVYKEWNGATYVTVTNTPPPGAWMQRYFLSVVSYADPVNPSIRKPANIPGSLIGISHGGNLIYTSAYRYEDPVALTGGGELLDVSAYDGVEAHLVDSLKLPNIWPRPVLVRDGHLIVGVPPERNPGPGLIESWSVSESAKLTRNNSIEIKNRAQSLLSVGDLLIAQAGTELFLYDISSPATLRFLGSGTPAGCLGYNVQKADGSAAEGLWLPLGLYGVTHIPVDRDP